MLNYFALLVLLVLLVTFLATLVGLAMAPGIIAARRGHPQTDAINVCGWMGVLTLGILLPLAFVWAYYKPAEQQDDDGGNA